MQNTTEPIILNNRYQLEERLGSGGMAMVYRAHDLTLERAVAIKILRKDYSNDPEFRERFHLEAKAAANLSHPNIVTVHDFGLYKDRLFIVMEYVPGTDLKTILKQRGRLNIQEAIELITQASAGVGYAHRAGLIHCDIKPQNMLVTPEKRLKVLDFGIARALSAISPDERTDIVWGSPQYFSPEQATGGAPSPASDVYSLGVIFFEMLTGKLPFVASTAQDLARQHRECLPPSPRKYNPSIPVPLEQIVLKILAKEPSARYRTADQLGRVLTNYSQQYIRPGLVSAPKLEPNAAEKRLNNGVTESRPTLISSLSVASNADEVSSPILISPVQKREGFDWVTWGLGLLTLILIGGLLPFWLWVFLELNSPVK